MTIPLWKYSDVGFHLPFRHSMTNGRHRSTLISGRADKRSDTGPPKLAPSASQRDGKMWHGNGYVMYRTVSCLQSGEAAKILRYIRRFILWSNALSTDKSNLLPSLQGISSFCLDHEVL